MRLRRRFHLRDAGLCNRAGRGGASFIACGLRQAIQSIRKGGTLSIPGVYGRVIDKLNFGAAFGKGIHMSIGQTPMHKYLAPLLKHVEDGDMDPMFLISHRCGIEEVPEMYKLWRDKQDALTRIVNDRWTD